MLVFCSYTLRDGLVTIEKLRKLKELISKSADCYIDILDNDSIDKQERVVEELSKAQLVLVLMSPDLKKIRMGKRGVSHCEREKYSNFRNQH